MGVRFQCPSGHKLHVKAELAGKRGICPECGAKFIVPSFSGGRAPLDTSTPPPHDPPPSKGGVRGGMASTPASAASPPSSSSRADDPNASIIIQTQPAPPIAPPAAAPAPAIATNHEPIAWYVRPPDGGQFGPATTQVLHEWIEAGRVAVDSWVWRTGWPDWKPGGEALALIPDRVPLVLAPAMDSLLDAPAAAHIEPGSAEARRAEIKRRKQRVRKLSTVLALVALTMLMALVFVLAR